MKKLIFDVTYHEDSNVAKTVALEFDNFNDKVESKSYVDESELPTPFRA